MISYIAVASQEQVVLESGDIHILSVLVTGVYTFLKSHQYFWSISNLLKEFLNPGFGFMRFQSAGKTGGLPYPQ